MLDRFQQNNKSRFFLRRIFSSQRFLTVLALGILIAIGFPLVKNIKQRNSIDNEIKGMQDQINSVENKNNDLRKLIDYFSSSQFVEEQARLNFGLKKEGESVAVVKNSAPATATSDTAGAQTGTDNTKTVFNIPGLDKNLSTPGEPNPVRWYKYFFNR